MDKAIDLADIIKSVTYSASEAQRNIKSNKEVLFDLEEVELSISLFTEVDEKSFNQKTPGLKFLKIKRGKRELKDFNHIDEGITLKMILSPKLLDQ